MYPKRITSGVSSAGVPFYLSPSGGYDELSESGYKEAARRWNLVSEMRDEIDNVLGNVSIRKPKVSELLASIDDWFQRLSRQVE